MSLCTPRIMDPRNRLWAELIFPHCEPAALLTLRAVCPAFRDLLNVAPARLWTPLTIGISRMRYADRILGWPGVVRAVEREQTIRANCAAGRFVCGPSHHIPDVWRVQHVGGRIGVFLDGGVRLYDLDGVLVASLDVDRSACDTHEVVVMDRWVPMETADLRTMLVDFVAARLVEVPTARPDAGERRRLIWEFSAAGPCLSVRSEGRADVEVWHVSAGRRRHVLWRACRSTLRFAASSCVSAVIRIC